MKKYLDKCFLGSKKNVVEDKYPNVKILIDNGHGMDTLGKCSPYSASKVEPNINFYEWEWNREIAIKIVSELMSKGYNASLLVTENNDISLSERVSRVNKICDEYGANNVILISIHANAAGNGTSWMNAKGWSAFTTKGKTKSDEISNYLYEEAENNFSDRKIRTDISDGDKDWESNFTIIKNTKCPAVLTENFFYDNVDDVKYILSDEGKKAVIKTHVDGIINYIKDNF
jgi:N-acetylmuramoyl-L-alanine amidase